MSCPHCASGASAPVLTGLPTIVFVGNPNVGKSTLFNRVTGSRQDTRNAPGTTVDLAFGKWKVGEKDLRVIDSPGTYSLVARSADEQVVTDLLSGQMDSPDLIVAVLDASAISRSLYLLGQLSRTGLPVVAALSMLDVAADEGEGINAGHLSTLTGIPVIEVDPRTGGGIALLGEAVTRSLVSPSYIEGPAGDCLGTRCTCHEARALTDVLANADPIFTWVEKLSGELTGGHRVETTRSDKMDSFLLHPLIGIPVLLGVLWLLFQLTTAVAAPVMAWGESLVTGPVMSLSTWLTSLVGLDGTWVESLLNDGVLAGVGVVISFVPLMFIMFFAIALLEDCGYLARAALLSDRIMRSIGLDGRAVLPLIVGFGCNVPALAATRTLPNTAHRVITAILVPYASCAARLTVYILIAATFFPKNAGTVVFCMYLGSLALIVLGGLILRLFIKDQGSSDPLLLVLPPFQKPRLLALAISAGRRALSFLKGAGATIVIMLTIVWGLMAIPATGDHAIADVPVEDSLYAQSAKVIAPVFEPAGFNDWHAAASLVTGFVAKETVVAALAQSYYVDEPAENDFADAESSVLSTRLQADFDRSSNGHGGAAAIAFLVFVLAYTPCVATLAEQKRMLGTKITLMALGAQLAIAWVLAVATFQIGALL